MYSSEFISGPRAVSAGKAIESRAKKLSFVYKSHHSVQSITNCTIAALALSSPQTGVEVTDLGDDHFVLAYWDDVVAAVGASSHIYLYHALALYPLQDLGTSSGSL